MASDRSSAERVRCTTAWREERPPELRDCRHPWDRLDVTAQGEAMACCFARETVGNVLEDGLHAVLTGSRRVQLQQDVASNRINPGCFNAQCMYAHMSLRRPWSVFFPADRFGCRGKRVGGAFEYEPSLGDGLFVEGPARFFPAARIEAAIRLARPRWWEPAGGQALLEVVDERGVRHASAAFAFGRWRSPRVGLAFALAEPHPYRLGLRLSLKGVPGRLLFDGVQFSGAPLEAPSSTVISCTTGSSDS